MLKYIKIKQDSLTLYLFKLSTKDLIDNSIIEHYDSSASTGYQRPPKPSHYKKIAKYLRDYPSAILPTSILAAIDSNDVEESTIDNESNLLLKNKFRIVDGQHRIEGIKYLKDLDDTSRMKYDYILTNYEFPIVLMEINGTNKILEIDTFININSKGLKVSTNLAKELSENIHREKLMSDAVVEITAQVIQDVSTNISKRLGIEKSSNWYDLITFADDLSYAKPISINAFSKAISSIVSIVLNSNDENLKGDSIDNAISNIAVFINSAWSSVMKKWKDCFEDVKSEGYNIRKGIGVYSLYGILSDELNKSKSFKLALANFDKILQDSNVKSSDWSVGGTFSGMTSSQSIKKIMQIIKNEEQTQ